LSQDPLFVNAAGNDYHVQSTSPAINRGTTLTQVTTDLDGVTRPQGAGYDLGAYELPVTPVGLPGDLTGDGQVTLADLRLLIQMLVGQVPPDLGKADLNQDGRLTLADVRALIQILVSP